MVSTTLDMWNEEKSIIESQLAPYERLLWSGRPRQGIFLRGTDVALIPFSLMWCGFAIFWETGVLTTNAPFFFRLWGIPFVLVGLYMVFGRFIADAKQRSKTYYGVTSERVIIVSGVFSRKTKSLNLGAFTDVSLDEKSNGGGIITFGATNPISRWGGGRAFPAWGQQQLPPNFELAQGARSVYETIRTAQRKALQGQAQQFFEPDRP